MNLSHLCCIGALRSPMGKFGKSFKEIPVYDLAAEVIKKLLERVNLDPKRIDEVLIGNCRQAGNGPNPGRTAAVKGGIPIEVPVTTINMACPSGMKAVEIALMKLALKEAEMILVGGMESMSTMPYLLKDFRWKGFGFGNKILYDGWADSMDPLIQQGMGQTAENLNEKYQIPREEQDAYAARSHEKAHEAWEKGYFHREVVPCFGLNRDETIRYPVNREKMASLPPVFKTDGTVTAANACSMADGAAFLLLTRKEIVEKEGYPILAVFEGIGQAAVSPALMGEGPAVVIPKVLKQRGLSLDDIDILEVNEAFAVQILANERVLKWDREKLNPHGGAIALGHPTGCSGARILVTLIHALHTHDKEWGLASLCGAGGVTMATLVRRIG